jgi:hypothetical protein
MTEFIKVEDRRKGDPALNLIAARLETLHKDVGDMKSGLKDLAIAITRLAVVEERLSSGVQAQERAFKEIGRVNDDVKAVASRVAVLETAAPLQKKTSDWMLSAVWAAAGAAVSFLAVKVGLK